MAIPYRFLLALAACLTGSVGLPSAAAAQGAASDTVTAEAQSDTATVVPLIQKRRAEAVARAWLDHLDAGRYAAAWAALGRRARRNADEAAWIATTRADRAPLGPLQRRETEAVAWHRRLPHTAPDTFVVVTFRARFGATREATRREPERYEAIERVVVERLGPDAWRPVGYVLRHERGLPHIEEGPGKNPGNGGSLP